MTINLLDTLTANLELPSGCQHWAIHSVHPDGLSPGGYTWPSVPAWVEAKGPFTASLDTRPSTVGDGLCVAHNWGGMASGRIPAITLVVVAYATEDILADSSDRVRLKRARVATMVDGQRLLRQHGVGANLQGANLRGADLWDANLTGADLTGADLTGANLTGANLTGANLKGANLKGANLTSANLTSADLQAASLALSNLWGASLRGADLKKADLSGANVRSATLTDADFTGANLSTAYLQGGYTVWPAGFDWSAAGVHP